MMLGRTASGLFWMMRYLERAENTARLVDAGFRLSMTHAAPSQNQWQSVLTTTNSANAFNEAYDEITTDRVTRFLISDRDNPQSVFSALHAARENARMTRTALTREVWEAMNIAWMSLRKALDKDPRLKDLPAILALIRQQGAQVRGAIVGTMLRNDIYRFLQIGSMIERADNTARILDTKYYILLPSSASVGSSVDRVQWEMILRSASADRAFHWLNRGEPTPKDIADFLIMDTRLPRSISHCYDSITIEFAALAMEYHARTPAHELADEIEAGLTATSTGDILRTGLHEFLQDTIRRNAALAAQIEIDYRFYV